MAGFDKFTTPYRDDHLIEVRCRTTAGGFSGEASAYFGPDGTTTMGASLQEFAAGLSQYPIPDTGGIPLRNGFGEGEDHTTTVVTMRLQPFGIGNRGQVYVEVELANEPEWPDRSTSLGQSRFPVWVDYASLQQWSRDLLDLSEGRIERALIPGIS